MEAKCYRAMRRAQGKMLREYFSGVSVESLSRRYGYSVIKIKAMCIVLVSAVYLPQLSVTAVQSISCQWANI